MPNVKEITRESWILATFPEWGTWLNEEIEEEVVPEGNFAMWWLGNCGTWIKTPGGANVVMDLWSNRGKSTKKVKDMVRGHQMANMAGVRKLQPNLRVQPMVIDPFAINELDYYLVSHFHLIIKAQNIQEPLSEPSLQLMIKVPYSLHLLKRLLMYRK